MSVASEPATRSDTRRVKLMRPPSLSIRELVQNVGYLWQYRDLLLTLSAHRIRVRYKQSMLGLAWAILQPFSLMLIYTVIFSIVVRVNSEGVPYSLFAYAALLIWTFFSTAISNAATGLVTHTNLITKVYFPREILPLSYVLAAIFDFLIASIVLAGLMIYFHVPPTVTLIWGIPILFIGIVFSTALALLLSATQVWFRDVGIAIPLILQLWMFASPVVYPLTQVPARFRSLYILNPMVGVVENFRRVIVQGQAPDVDSIRMAALISFVLLPFSYAYFKRMDSTMADVI